MENPKPKPKIIDSLWTFFVAVMVAGPFALPLLWRNPRFSAKTKILGSVIVIVYTIALTKLATGIFSEMMAQYEEILKSAQ